jgi:GT2 family glycosyltransferase
VHTDRNLNPDVSVVIPCHDESRWSQTMVAVRSARSQVPAPVEVILVIDHNPALLARALRELDGVTVLANQFAQGVSGTRNTGAQHSRTALIVMLDDDATPSPGWLAGLVEPFGDQDVIGTGGAINPSWSQPGQPSWFPDEFLWAVGGSYTGQPDSPTPVRNVWSASMGVRRDVFESVGGFRIGFGKLGARARPEDTDLCLRMALASGGQWMYVPASMIAHPVPAVRGTVKFFLSRCYQEGRGKVEMARLLRGHDSLTSERNYLRRTLPRAFVDGIAASLHGRDTFGLAKSAAIFAGVTVAAIGGAVELLLGRPAAAASTPSNAARALS